MRHLWMNVREGAERTRTPVLFALDELPATALAKLDTYLATLGSYGGTLLLYLQTISQLDDVYGKAKAQTILGNCHTKLYYPPRDLPTAEHVSKVFGTELRLVRSDSHSAGSGGFGSKHPRGPQTSQSYTEKEVPALAATELDALPAEAVIVLAQAAQQVRVLAERLNPLWQLGTLPAPPALRPHRRAAPGASPMAAARGHVSARTGVPAAMGSIGRGTSVAPSMPTTPAPPHGSDSDSFY